MTAIRRSTVVHVTSILLIALLALIFGVEARAVSKFRRLQNLPDRRPLDVLPSSLLVNGSIEQQHLPKSEDGLLNLTRSVGSTVRGKLALRTYVDFMLYLATDPVYGPRLGPYGIAYFSHLFSQKKHVVITPSSVTQFLEMIEGNTENEILPLFNVIVPLRLGVEVGLPVCFKTLDELNNQIEDYDDNYRETISLVFSEMMRLHSRITFDPRVTFVRSGVRRLIDLVLDDIVLLHRDLHFAD